MPRITSSADRIIDADAAAVWAALTDYSGARAQILPDNYEGYKAERDPIGGAAILSFTLKAGGRERAYRMEVVENEPSHMLTERDLASTYTTRWKIEHVGSGAHVRVRLSSEWESRATGIGGFFERRFAPRGVQRIHQETLIRLGRLMRERQESLAGQQR